MGALEILNVAAGDVKITFNHTNCPEAIRAKRIIEDMMRRGYALVVEVDRNGEKAYERVQAFDPDRGEYLIADFDPSVASKPSAPSGPTLRDGLDDGPPLPVHPLDAGLCDCGRPSRHRGACKGKPRGRSRLPMETAKATGIGRSAGG